MVPFNYCDALSTSAQRNIKYDFISSDFITIEKFKKNKIIKVDYQGLELLSEHAFVNASFYLRSSHLKLLKKILDDNNTSSNDKYVALELLKNAIISAEKEFPMCQDTGTAIVIGKKGQQIWTNYSDKEAISKGIYNAFTTKNLRYSQNIPISMYEEINSGCNLPAQIELYSTQGNKYEFIFIAKGGGSANKTFLFQKNKTILTEHKLLSFIKAKMKMIGTSGCPPYHMVIVIGGTSAEYNLKTVKLASSGHLDGLPTKGNKKVHGFRDIELENKLFNISKKTGIGAQYGGLYFCHDIRVIRLPRHGASCPIGIGVSCSADRNIEAKITENGIFIEKLEKNPGKFLPKINNNNSQIIKINLNQPINNILKTLTEYPISTKLSLSGKIIVARDIAHSKLKNKINNKEKIPDYLRNNIIYYAGPAKTPTGYPSGSFGPTTSSRMDSYISVFQANGFSMITLGKGNRSKDVVTSCKKYGGFYLGSIGGTAARIGKDFIKSVKLIEYPELGMEAIFMIEVVNFPAFILIDDKGNDFFSNLL